MPTETFAITESVFCQLSVLFCTLRHQTPKALDHDEIAARLAAIRQGREVEEQDIAQRLERLHAKELEQEHEAEVQRERGPGHEL